MLVKWCIVSGEECDAWWFVGAGLGYCEGEIVLWIGKVQGSVQ